MMNQFGERLDGLEARATVVIPNKKVTGGQDLRIVT